MQAPAVTNIEVRARNGTSAAIHGAALKLFAERGYEAATMKAIAEEVGVGASAIYNHVESKQALLRAIVTGTIQDLINRARAAIDSTDDIEEQLRRTVRQHVAYHAKHRYEMLISEAEIPSLEQPSQAHQIALRAEYVKLFVNLIEQGAARGLFRTENPQIAARAIMQMGMGVSIWYHADGELTPEDLGELYGDFAIKLVS